MNIGLLTKRRQGLAEKIKFFLKEQGHKVNIYTSDNLYLNKALFKNDFFVLKSKKGIFLYAGCYLKSNGLPVIPDPHISYRQRNRKEAHFLVKEAQLLAPKYFMGKIDSLKRKLKNEKFSLILKPLMGSGGEGIRVIESINELNIDNKKIIFLEEFIEGTHYNVTFIGDEICTCVKPPLCPNSKEMEMVSTSKDIEETVFKWKKVHDIQFGHLDIVREHDTDNLYIVDPGAFPQFSNWKYDKNPAPKICKLILARLKQINS